MNLSGSPFDYVVAFIAGFLVSLTPCVYPLLPVSIGYIGIRSEGSRLKGFFLSLIYTIGIALTYSLLGLFASLTGRLFGSISVDPRINIFVGIVIILFGLSMFGLFEIPIPYLNKRPSFKKGSFLSTFILGLVSGLIISPCLTPVLGSILAYITTKQNIFYGASLLFVFAFGMGFIFILSGTLSVAILSLPKLGKISEYIKKIFSLIIIIFGLYMIVKGIRG